MKSILNKRITQFIIILSALTLASAQSGAFAASKTITCYKGSATKSVTGTNPKCPTGYSLTKPAAAPTAKASTAATTTAKVSGPQTFSATYKGSLNLLWTASDVTAQSVTATGTGTTLGLDELTGKGGAAPTGQCDAFFGSGTLGSGANTLAVKFDGGMVCADDAAAPTDVAISGNVAITGGTGKFAGATGSLKVGKGSTFQVRSTTAGKTISETFTLILSGTITTK